MNRKVIVVPFDEEGNIVEGDFIDGLIGEASSIEDARELAVSLGYTPVEFDAPDSVPGELIGEREDAFAVGVNA